MKRIILIASIFLSTLVMADPGAAQAKVHHKHHKVHHAAVRMVYTAPREHGVNANAGVGLGPIHVGVGGGVNVH